MALAMVIFFGAYPAIVNAQAAGESAPKIPEQQEAIIEKITDEVTVRFLTGPERNRVVTFPYMSQTVQGRDYKLVTE
ncbi:MAG: hypothetical protein UZ22_OP11002000633 [Microgenomates bacterium OLB23]|nr:MAG: hypothetical protein UZ22_OP11002000633 [Microgenomates bacterium OLB23]